MQSETGDLRNNETEFFTAPDVSLDPRQSSYVNYKKTSVKRNCFFLTRLPHRPARGVLLVTIRHHVVPLTSFDTLSKLIKIIIFLLLFCFKNGIISWKGNKATSYAYLKLAWYLAYGPSPEYVSWHAEEEQIDMYTQADRYDPLYSIGSFVLTHGFRRNAA